MYLGHINCQASSRSSTGLLITTQCCYDYALLLWLLAGPPRKLKTKFDVRSQQQPPSLRLAWLLSFLVPLLSANPHCMGPCLVNIFILSRRPHIFD